MKKKCMYVLLINNTRGGGGGGVLGMTLVSTPLRIWRALRNIEKHVF